MIANVAGEDLVVPFGGDLAVPVSERRVGMGATVEGTANPIRTKGGDTINDENNPDPFCLTLASEMTDGR